MDCDWNNPGNLPARNNNVAVMISSYGYPKSDAAVLVEKIRRQDNDGTLLITRNGLIGIGGTPSNFSDMHFRNGRCSGNVSMASWPQDRQEKALVYCSNNNCVAIPIICGNISRITWQRKEKPEPEIKLELEKINNVPEPSTLLLVAIGILALVRFMPR